jgi:putative salt-induced outer membrane protein YdiY
MLFLAHLLAALALPPAGEAAPNPPTSPLQDAPPEYPMWKGALGVGASWSGGNTESSNLAAVFNAERRDEKDRWTFEAWANYGKNKDLDTGVSTTTNDNYGAGVKYDYFVSKKLYWLARVSGKIDHVATLDLQTTGGLGVGYQWKETEKVKWGTEAGLSYVVERFEDSTADADYTAARLASNLSYVLSESASFEQTAEVLPSLEDSEDVIARIDNRLKLAITGKWIAQLQYVLEYDDSPPPGKQEADHRFVASLGWSF